MTFLHDDLLARSREIRRLRVIAGAVLDDQLTRLRSGYRRTEGHANRARRFGVFKLASHVVAETAKSPVVEIAIPVRSTGWLFVSVNVFAAPVVPTFLLRIDSAGRRQCRRFDARPRQRCRLRTINGVVGQGERTSSLTQSRRREGNAYPLALLPSKRGPTGVRGDCEVPAGRDAADLERARACVCQRHRLGRAGRADHLIAKKQ
jgi:hypothetical protein